MWRFDSLRFIVAVFCTTVGLGGSALFGGEDHRASVFRELTSDQPTAPRAQKARVEKAAAASSSEPVATAAGPIIVAPQISSQAQARSASPAIASAVRQTSFHGGYSARQIMSQFPRRATLQLNPQRVTRRHPKPFETAEHEPTISPYLNLDRDENDPQDIPNYLTLVLPQIEQMQMDRTQQREIQQLRGQLQNMSANVIAAPAFEMNSSTGMGGAARFMDTAQFYRGMR